MLPTIFVLESTSDQIVIEHFAVDELAQPNADMRFRAFFRPATRARMIYINLYQLFNNFISS